MKITVTARHVDLAEPVRQQVQTRLQRLERLLNDNAVSAQCVLSHQRGRFLCELTVHAREDHILRALGRDAQVVRAVTLAVEKVAHQAQRLKERWKGRRRSGGNGTARPVPTTERIAVDAEPRVIRSRRAGVKPMSLDDAMLELTGGDQAFLVFRDASSDSVSILYRRPDGNFGLIEPEA